MIELDGEIYQSFIGDMPETFTEASWMHQYSDMYYLSLAMNFHQQPVGLSRWADSDRLLGLFQLFLSVLA